MSIISDRKKALSAEGFASISTLKIKVGFFEYVKTIKGDEKGVVHISYNKNGTVRVQDVTTYGRVKTFDNIKEKHLSEYVFVKPVTMELAKFLKNVYLGGRSVGF